AVWSATRREALRAKLGAIDPGQGAARFARIAAVIDGGAERWSAMHVEACRATRVEGRQSELLLDRRIACLDRWLGELADTVGVAERAGDRGGVDQAVRASTALSPLAACADVRALSEELPPPAGAAERATAIALADRTQELEVEQRAGRIAGLPSKVRDVVAAARPLDHAPTLAAALVVRARVDFAVEDHIDAESALRELAQVAAQARDDRSAAFAWIHLLVTIGKDEGKPAEARALIPMATAAVLRAGDPPDLRADLLFSQAGLEEGPHPAAALELLTRSRALLERSGATGPGSPFASRLIKTMSEIAAVHAGLGELDAAIASYRDAIERWRALYGNDSPDEAFTWSDLAAALHVAGKHDESIAAYRHALAIREARLGDDSLMTTFSREVLAMTLHLQGRWNEALEVHDQAIRSYRAQVPAGDTRLTRTLGNRAETLTQLGRFDEAARGYAEVLALLERDPTLTADIAMTLFNRGELLRKRGRCPDARRDYTRAAGLAESLHEAGAALLIYSLVGEAACLLGSRQFDDAIARLNRALQLEATADEAFEVALARAYLGRAQVETRRDVVGGLAAVRSARAAMAAAADATNAGTVRELDAWLAAHAR
ncbi:MAG TPA: tetratricopeptide repeat protein, partial [Kofleriaceae bacterium]|nr:tetratricopeptide repeat protein [Kofleriaceae bacterium]